MTPWLHIVGLKKAYGARDVVDCVTISVDEGEIFALLGPSGAGKSTVLKILAGMVPPDCGRVCLRDRDITDLPATERNIGMVFQDYSLFPLMTVRENVAFPLIARQVRTASGFVRWHSRMIDRRSLYRKVDQVLDAVRMTQHAAKKPDELSGGEQQRVAIARALVSDPDLLCLDEPFSALDKNLRDQLQAEIRELQERLKKTIVYVTHDQTEAMSVANRLAILREGRVVQTGTPAQVYRTPLDPFVATFLGECNLLPFVLTRGLSARMSVITPAGTIFDSEVQPRTGDGLLGIRPEALRLSRQPWPDAPCIRGNICRARFFGSQLKFDVSVGNGDVLRVTVTANGNLQGLRTGCEVWVGYDPADVFFMSSPSPECDSGKVA